MKHDAASDLQRLGHMIEQHGLCEVVEMLSEACVEKSERYDVEGHDVAAKAWGRASDRLCAVAIKLEGVLGSR